jgi:hypothetical protein
MTGYIKNNSQEDRILRLFRERGERGVMVYELTAPRPEGLGISQYNARIYGLREKGFNIISESPGHFILDETTERPIKEEEKPRTLKQNGALHLLFSQLADELNNAGLDMRKTLKPTIDIPWSGDSIKEYLWRPIMKAQVGKESTTELSTKDIDQVFDTINRHLGEKFGLTINFPSIETIINNNRANGI